MCVSSLNDRMIVLFVLGLCCLGVSRAQGQQNSFVVGGDIVSTAGNLTVGGNKIKKSGGADGITFDASGAKVIGTLNATGDIITTSGCVTVGGNKILKSGGADGITFNGTGATVNGALTATGAVTATNSLTVKSGTSGQGIFSSTPTTFDLQTYQALIVGSTSSYYQLYSGPGQPMYFDAEWNWRFRDKGHGNAERILFDAATGTINNVSGDYQTSFTTRIYHNGDANLKQVDVTDHLVFHNDASSTSSIGAVGGQIFARDGRMKVTDARGFTTTFSPHDDPRSQFPQARTSFGDAQVALPFSFHHENAYIGKAQYVDMAKLVQYTEKKMKAELGPDDGQLVFTYDLPAEKIKTAADRDVETVLEKLKRMPKVKVALGADGALPDAAVELVDEVNYETRTVTVPERRLDLQARRVVTENVQKEITEAVKTGRQVWRIKEGWVFEGGELYRPPTLNDLDLNAIVARNPRLPQWVLDRMKARSGQSVSSLIDEIQKQLATVTSGGTEKTMTLGMTRKVN